MRVAAHVRGVGETGATENELGEAGNIPTRAVSRHGALCAPDIARQPIHLRYPTPATSADHVANQSLVLLGDSILHNDSYTRPEPGTTEHITRLLPEWSVRRLAIDGSKMADIAGQLRGLTDPPT